MTKTPRIFIGGTGRSGTTILYKILGNHPEIYALKDEIRFIIDYNGLINLFDSLTRNFSPSQAGRAIIEFKKMMLFDLTNKRSSPYPWYQIQEYLGNEFYFDQINSFIAKLTDGNFKGNATWVPDSGHTGVLKYKRAIIRRVPMFSNERLELPIIPIPKYFSDKNELFQIFADFVDELFLKCAVSNNKKTWVEKTPYNILHFSFLRSLFPNALFIHIKRDPRSVVQSYSRQIWASSKIEDSAMTLKHVIRKWLDEKKEIQEFSQNYIEIKLEDLVQSPQNLLLDKIKKYCSLQNTFEYPDELDQTIIKKARGNLSQDEYEIITKILKDEIVELGYSL